MTFSNIKRQKGYVLVMVLWLLVIFSVFVGFGSLEIDQLHQSAYEELSDYELELARYSTEQTLLYLLATRESSYAGLQYLQPYAERVNDPFQPGLFVPSGPTLRLDGRKYSGADQLPFSVQDAASLVSLRSKDDSELDSLLSQLGKTRPERERLIARLRDHTDRDGDVRLNGYEARSTRQGGPINRFVVSPLQLKDVRGWKNAFTDSEWRWLFREISIYVGSRWNVNSMTPAGMRMIGLSRSDIDEIIDWREIDYVANVGQLSTMIGEVARIDPVMLAFTPSKYFRLGFEDRTSTAWVGVTMTPDSLSSPWVIDYRIRVTTNETENGKTKSDNRQSSEKDFRWSSIFTNEV